MNKLFQIIVKSRVAQIVCCLAGSYTIWANRLCAGMSVPPKQMYASLLLDYLMCNLTEDEEGEVSSDLTEEQIYIIFDKIADLLCMRYNLCMQNDSTILIIGTGDTIQWTDLEDIDDVSDVAYQWNN